MNDRQLSLFLRHAFSLTNAENQALKGADPAFVRSMQGIKQIVENLPEGSLRLAKTWRELEPAVLRALRPYNDAFRDSLFDKLPELTPEIEEEVMEMLSAVGVPNPIGTAGQVLGAPTDAPFALNQRLADTAQEALKRTSINNVNLAKLFETKATDKGAVSLWMRQNYRTVDRIVQTGILQGASTDAIAKQISEEASLGGLLKATKGTATGAIKAQARAVARTAVQSFNTQVTERVWAAQDDDVFDDLVYEWTAALDARVCPTCGPLDGRKEKERRDLPPVPIHPQCRCQVIVSDPDEDDDVRTGIQLSETKPTGNGAYATKVKVGGKSFYRKAVEIKKPGASYADYLADLAQKDTKNSRLTLAEYFGGIGKAGQGASTMGVQRAEWFRKAVTEHKVRPDKALNALVTGGPGVQTTLRTFKAPPKDFPSGGTAAPKPKAPKPKPPAPKAKAVPKPAAPAQAERDFVAQHQWDNGKNKLSHEQIADSLAVAAAGKSQSAKNMQRMMQFMQQKQIETVWSNGREKLGKGDFEHWKDPSVVAALRKGKGKGEGITRAIADGLEKDSENPFLLQVGKVSRGAAGHTVESTHLVVLKQETRFIPIKNKELKRIKDSIEVSVAAAEDGNPLQITGSTLYKRVGKTSMGTDVGWLTTYVHEMGHQVHFRAGRPSMLDYAPKKLKERASKFGADAIKALDELAKLSWSPSKYGTTNLMEHFAETFVQYVFAPEDLKKASPMAYQWVDEALAKALK